MKNANFIVKVVDEFGRLAKVEYFDDARLLLAYKAAYNLERFEVIDTCNPNSPLLFVFTR